MVELIELRHEVSGETSDPVQAGGHEDIAGAQHTRATRSLMRLDIRACSIMWTLLNLPRADVATRTEFVTDRITIGQAEDTAAAR